jgi:hypothetical protein
VAVLIAADDGSVRQLVMWRGLDVWRAEVATLELGADAVSAHGTQLGVDPVPYRLDYELSTGTDFVTEHLSVDVSSGGWRRRLRLARHADGSWHGDWAEYGDAPFDPSGGDLTAIGGALDCDLAFSPLTNLMPIRRHRLHDRPGEVDLLVAWVSVPDLAVHPSRQRYEHVRLADDASVVRFRARDPDFVCDLLVDRDGLVQHYPDLAERVPT